MAKRLKIGDLVRVKLLNDKYMWVHVLFDVRWRLPEDRMIDPSNYFFIYGMCYLVNVYAQISSDEELKDETIFFKGIFIPRRHLAKETVIANMPVDYKSIDFPETTGGSDDNCLWKGELSLGMGKIPETKIKEWNDRFNGNFCDVYSVADSVLWMQKRESEMQRTNYPAGWKFVPKDFRYYPEYREEVWQMIGEDPNQSYYELALKHGFDLARFY